MISPISAEVFRDLSQDEFFEQEYRDAFRTLANRCTRKAPPISPTKPQRRRRRRRRLES